MKYLYIIIIGILTLCSSCIEPPLHLPDEDIPEVELMLEVTMDVDIDAAVQTEWYYGWDEQDSVIFGDLSYVEPTSFQIRRYYTGDSAYAAHQHVLSDLINGKSYRTSYEWGYWDLLLWNDIKTIDNIQSLRFNEQLDYVTATTGQTTAATRYQGTRQTRSYYQPELLYSAYSQGLEIDRDLKGFTYDAERNVYYKQLNVTLHPLTYIYLTQVIIHNNRGRITGVDGNGNFSGMAQSVNLNTGVTGSEPITVHYYVRFKNGCSKKGESVDIAGGRLITFGTCNVNNLTATKADDADARHYMDVNFQFSNGNDSTLVFDITDQVRQKLRGGVITVELDADTLKIPKRKGGSGFDAVVKDFEDGGTHEFEM